MKSLWPLCAALSALLVAPVASAAEIQRPEETAYVFVDAPDGWEVVYALYPRHDVAVLFTEEGRPEGTRSRWKGVGYAVHPEEGSFEGGVNVTFGEVGGLFGRFVPSGPALKGHRNRFCKGPRPLSESGHFVGRIVLKGDGGYLRVDVGHARESVSRSFRLRCKQGHAQHSDKFAPSLFGYIDPPTRSFSSTDGTMLLSHLNSKHRVREFMALQHLHDRSSTFKAAVLEWLPGDVATARWAETSGVAVDTFTTGEPRLHPASAVVDPPFPFSGTATYSRRGHSLRGDLSVAFPGLKLRLAGKQAEAGLCVFTRQMQERVCGGRFS